LPNLAADSAWRIHCATVSRLKNGGEIRQLSEHVATCYMGAATTASRAFGPRHTVEAAGLMRFIGKCFAPCATVAAALLGWVAAISGASAQTPASDDRRFPSIDEVRFGAMMHNAEPGNDEDGVDLNLEVLFRRAAIQYSDAFLNVVLRPRVHLGASINLAGETSQLYAGLTWDVKLAPKFSLEVTFGGALHDGPTGGGHADSYGCAVNFRESASLGYDLDERWTIYGTVAHMSNGNLCDYNSGLTSVGVRLGYKLR
jgi:hypothetical protein